ncbi:hypothetical protein BCON_0247g00160 [Botryotinia convoluta]|uniref:Uncharacterized protein n=1 Tax=Botryotinia convoluta TaxID=54673 RepID=A0A4Z1HLR3_9HELO|nr:hypothetical protein BCON_0247g00160 [Botryotinia convoluta]
MCGEMENVYRLTRESVFIAPPIPIQPHLAPAQPNLMEIERRHWAEKIFDDHTQPLSQALLKHRREYVEMLGSIDESYEVGYPSAIKSFVQITLRQESPLRNTLSRRYSTSSIPPFTLSLDGQTE